MRLRKGGLRSKHFDIKNLAPSFYLKLCNPYELIYIYILYVYIYIYISSYGHVGIGHMGHIVWYSIVSIVSI